ncbi:pectate lyase [Caulobacter sp. Root487D2Y]|uniref:pectate lyase n=1 Tax=Caulobacter sp. Root487D2Y TaxID=1736547 RepID=UPI0006F93E52|nr:pectate lyase [Caulobacter sp. Root487D2Y]KQY27407.1 pectate lyase [Caulobacter sp. Root487D2Y]
MTLRPLPAALALSAVLLCGTVAPFAHAAVVGTNTPARAISAARVEALPAKDRDAWKAYLARSDKQELADRAALAAELKPSQPTPPPPEEGPGGPKAMPLDRDAAWYASPEARHVADVIVSFQTPAGGWSKNQPRTGAPRRPGQPYAPDNVSKYLAADDFDTPRDPHWNYVGTLDNGATITELRFLAHVARQAPGAEGQAWRASFLRGVRYLLAAQFPNGGWPQVWPLEGGYHDAITYNDDAVTEAASLLTDVSEGQGDYAFAPADLRKQAAAAADRALACVLATQVVVNGKRTIWAQQHDALTLKPVAGRNFEPAQLSTEESADLLVYLMSLPNPSPTLVKAVHAGADYLAANAIHDQAWGGDRDAEGGRRLTPKPGAGPIWARYYMAGSNTPIFGDRDKTLHDDVNELTRERRNGYSWFNTSPKKALDAYAAWKKAHPAAD